MARLISSSSSCKPLILVLLMTIYNVNHVQAARHAPVFFTFGDSFYDVGQSNYLPTAVMKANIPPYGQTFFNRPTGRFSDGRIIPDFMAQYAEVPFAPPILLPGLSSYENGVNFACAAAGALNGTFGGRAISLTAQVDYFRGVAEKLQQQFGRRRSRAIISKAVYELHVGTNDYLYGFQTNPAILTPQYVSLVIGNITMAIKEIYRLGGQKFSITNIGPIGCFPLVKAALNTTACFQPASQIASLHNQQLSLALAVLARQYTGFKYGLFDMYSNLEKRINNPTSYGFKNSTSACCGSGPFRGIFSCGGQVNLPDYELCPNAAEYVFWDSIHYSEMFQNQLAQLIWSGSSPDIGPYNVKTLFNLRMERKSILAMVRPDPFGSNENVMSFESNNRSFKI